MTVADNKAVIGSFVEEVLNQGRLALPARRGPSRKNHRQRGWGNPDKSRMDAGSEVFAANALV